MTIYYLGSRVLSVLIALITLITQVLSVLTALITLITSCDVLSGLGLLSTQPQS